MTFEYPYVFWCFVGIAVIAILNRRWRDRIAVTFSSTSLLTQPDRTWRQRLLWLPSSLGILAASTAVLALARPRAQVLNVREEEEGIAIEMLVDVSSSMDMSASGADGRTSRLEIARRVLLEFVLGNGKELKGRVHDLVGIITFARYADTVCPLTLGHDALAYLAREIEVCDRPNEDGTAYGDATILAAARLKKLEELSTRSEDPSFDVKTRIIVLLTDGENNCGRHLPMEAAALAREWGIRIYAISMGEEPKAEAIEQGGDASTSDQVDAETTLRCMAELTGGLYRRAYDFDSLQAVYAEIDRLETSRLRPIQFMEYREFFWIFATASLFLALLDITARYTFLRTVP